MKRILGMLAGVALLYAGTANAALPCTGQLVDLRTDKAGTVLVDFGYGLLKVCSLSGPYTMAAPNNGVTISSQTCAGLYSAFLSAELTQDDMGVVIAETSCTGLVDTGKATKTILFFEFNN